MGDDNSMPTPNGTTGVELRIEGLTHDLNTLKSEVRDVIGVTKSLASSVATTQQEIKLISGAVTSIQSAIREDRDFYRNEMRSLGQQQVAAGKTNWPLLIAVLGFALGLTTTLAGLVAFAIRTPALIVDESHQRQIDDLRNRTDKIEDRERARYNPK